MQTITRGIQNNLVFTLTERVTLTNPFFLMWAKSRRTNKEVSFLLSGNVSTYTSRYDQFLFTEGTDATMTSGDWWYEIYEQSSSTNTNKQLANKLLEEGILRVLEDSSDTYITSDQDDIYIT